MSQLVKGSLAAGGQVLEDPWKKIEHSDDLQSVHEDQAILVDLPLWRSHYQVLLDRQAPIGLQLGPVDDPQEISPYLSRLALVAVEFPHFADGRGYSIARLLRERHRYEGELRAVGDVLRDQIFYMLRCGFDAFVPRPDRPIEGILQAYSDFREVYQASIDRPYPLFARRAFAQSNSVPS